MRNLMRSMLNVTFALTLFASQRAFSNQLAFNLNASNNSVVGQGMLEETSESSAKIFIALQGKEYAGAGPITQSAALSTLKLQRRGLRADRALFKVLGMNHKKHIQSLMVATDGTKLNCALNVFGNQVSGQCINLSNEQLLSVNLI